MDQFLRSAIDLSDIEAKVLSGGYESDSGYSTYDVSPITSSAPAQLSYPTPGHMAGIQTHGHHVEQSLFGCNLSPTATMFPGPPGMNQAASSILHDTIHSPCSSDVGFFSPHSGFSSHATTPSHHDALAFFPAHGACPIFPPYPQPQDFNSLNMSTCFPDVSVSTSNSTIPTFSSQIPDILLPDATLAPPATLSMPSATTHAVTPPASTLPKSEPIPMASKVQCSQETKAVENAAAKTAESVTEIKIEPCPNSCVFGSQSEATSVKTESKEEANGAATSKPVPISSQAILSKLLGTDGTPPTIVSITAVNNNGTTTKLNLSQFQALVGQSVTATTSTTASKGETKATSQSGSTSDSEVNSSTTLASPLKCKSGVSASSRAVPMKASQKKKGPWPRSMSKANLMAFREHILNKLKKGQESSDRANSDNHRKEEAVEESSKLELLKCETPSPSTCCEVSVLYERNHSAHESRCHSEPAEMLGGPHCSLSCVPLQHSHSESYLHLSSTSPQQQQQVFSGHTDADTKLADFFPQNCNDVLNLFQFNPDALLSTTMDDNLLDGIDLNFDDDDSCKVDNEIARFIDSDINGSTSESPMEIGVQYEVLRDHSPITTSPLSHHTSPLMSPCSYNSQPSSPQKTVTQSCSYSSASPTSSRPFLPERTLVTSHVTTGSMTTQMGMFNFPDMLAGGSEMGGVSCDSNLKLHIQQNLLQAHHDPLLTGSGTILQACGSEAFEF